MLIYGTSHSLSFCQSFIFSFPFLREAVFSDNTAFSTALNENGETVLTFTGAVDNFVVESYKLSLSEGLKTVYDTSFGGDYMFLFEDNVYSVNLGKLEAGREYKVSVTAENAYAEISQPYNYSFVAE